MQVPTNLGFQLTFGLIICRLIQCQDNPVSPANGYTTQGLVSATNYTANITQDFFLQVSESDKDLAIPIGSLTMITGRSLTMIDGVNSLCAGPLVVYNSTNEALEWGAVPMINCDLGDTAGSILAYINSGNNPCVLLYSEKEHACSLNIAPSNPLGSQLAATFTLFTGTVMDGIISSAPVSGENDSSAAVGYIGPTQSTLDSTSGWTENSSVDSHKTLGMGILYGVVGIVAALFFIIMFSGALRVHRYPERYGLTSDAWIAGDDDDRRNNGFSGSSQGRVAKAKALTRAMLDSIPLVKFQVSEKDTQDDEKRENAIRMNSNAFISSAGDNPNERNSRNLEGNTNTNLGDFGDAAVRHGDQNMKKGSIIEMRDGPEDDENDSPDVKVAHENAEKSNVFYGSEKDEYICPICFEGLQDGDILRVLPCQHKFHALCVDPWLLNSSSLCPLCRVDLSIQRNEEVPILLAGIDEENQVGSSSSNSTAADQNTDRNAGPVIPPGYDVSTNIFNRFLDTWNAHLLPKEARQTALRRFHEEAEIRRNLSARRNSSYIEQNQKRWLKFVNHRRLLHRNSTQTESQNQTGTSTGHEEA